MLNNLKDHLAAAHTMQLATVSDNQPWVCTVYFVCDEGVNLYWLSLPKRRHSQELAKNPKVAVAIQIKTDLPVIGIQAEGAVEAVNDPKIVEKIMENYVSKYGSGRDFFDRFISGRNKHQMYVFRPKKYVIFDEKNYSKNEIIEIKAS